jgi:N,N'-diacetyllegionaminate synthase
MRAVQIGERFIGHGHPCFLVAEIGINHNGDLDLARRMIDAAADAGADAVKFQNYRTEDFIADRSMTYEYTSAGKRVTETQHDLFKRNELSLDQLAYLNDHCKRRNMVFFSTPTNVQGIEALIRLGVPLLKNGSDYLTHLPLIQAMAQSGLAVVISTGMATLAEIDDAVRAFRGAGGQDFILLHCVSTYPVPPEDVNLRKIPALATAFGCPVGFSDHTKGVVAAIGAVAVGGCMIEKHFTLDRNLPGPDHYFSATPEEFVALAESVRTMEKCLGESTVGPAYSELVGKQDFRLSCVAAEDLRRGHLLEGKDIQFSRPGSGLPPKAADGLLGRRLKHRVPRGHVFEMEDFG